jgi:hypothetical protein
MWLETSAEIDDRKRRPAAEEVHRHEHPARAVVV